MQRPRQQIEIKRRTSEETWKISMANNKNDVTLLSLYFLSSVFHFIIRFAWKYFVWFRVIKPRIACFRCYGTIFIIGPMFFRHQIVCLRFAVIDVNNHTDLFILFVSACVYWTPTFTEYAFGCELFSHDFILYAVFLVSLLFLFWIRQFWRQFRRTCSGFRIRLNVVCLIFIGVVRKKKPFGHSNHKKV